MSEPARPSQRQWQRDRTALRIEQAALRVFVDVGCDAATAEQIAKAADVSVRTFFRYFPHGKVDVMVLEARRAMDVFEAALRERPREEPVITAVRAAADSMYEGPPHVDAGEAAWEAAWRKVPALATRMLDVEDPYGLELVHPDGRVQTVRQGAERVRLGGEPIEQLLFVFGRTGAARVERLANGDRFRVRDTSLLQALPRIRTAGS